MSVTTIDELSPITLKRYHLACSLVATFNEEKLKELKALNLEARLKDLFVTENMKMKQVYVSIGIVDHQASQAQWTLVGLLSDYDEKEYEKRSAVKTEWMEWLHGTENGRRLISANKICIRLEIYGEAKANVSDQIKELKVINSRLKYKNQLQNANEIIKDYLMQVNGEEEYEESENIKRWELLNLCNES